ncbi:MAG: GTPase ObgE, partial [Clostridia bacterium]
SIIFEVDKSATTLIDFHYSKHFRADEGSRGGPKNCTGKSGKDLIIKVPKGTLIKDAETGQVIEDMFYDDSKFVLLKGGVGGKGNARFATSLRKAPRFSQKGEATPEREIVLELKTIADVGLVGFPNVGKSTLLSVVSGAKPKIANYHFTTLSPNLGVVTRFHEAFVMADIPGLIEGASEGFGLGYDFLRHIERVRLIIHVVDISGCEGRDPFEDYVKINNELDNYDIKLSSLPQIVVANKCDLLQDLSVVAEFEKKVGVKVYPISAITTKGTKELIDKIFEELKTLPIVEPLQFTPFEYEKEDKNSYTITRCDDGAYLVEGGLVNQLIRNVVLSDTESFSFFQRMLREKGVIKNLYKKGAKDGDIVRIGDIEFEMID